jgi:hypothetical protein
MYWATTAHSPAIVENAKKIWRENVLSVKIPLRRLIPNTWIRWRSRLRSFPRSSDRRTDRHQRQPNHEERRIAPASKATHSPVLPVATEEDLTRKDTVRITDAEYQRFKDLEKDLWINYGISLVSKSRLYRVGLKQLLEDYEKHGEQSLLIRSLREEKA